MGKVSVDQTPTVEQIKSLRDLFFKRLETEKPGCNDGEFHPDDIDRVKTSDRWLQLFLEQSDLEMKGAMQQLWDTCIWRKNFGTNEINEDKIRMDYVNTAAMFPHNVDKDGKVLLIIKSKNHTKGSKDMNELIKVLVYWIERIFRQTNYDQLTLFFDMQGAGLANMDLDFVKRIVDTFKLYYPNSINFIVIFEMAWILNAAFKIIKGLLPPKAVEKMKFLNTKTIKDCVNEENMLACWGGKDDYEFKFEPEKKERAKRPSTTSNPPIDEVAKPERETNEAVSYNNNPYKKVTFADTKMVDLEMEPTLLAPGEQMLRITPADYIAFLPRENELDLTGTVDICCVGKFPITYKIKTTSPEKFLVRPSSGILPPGCAAKINVTLQRGHQLLDINKDKFLVMCTMLPDNMDVHSTHNQISEFWKTKTGNSPRIEQHRLRCVGSHDNPSNPADGIKNGRLSTPGIEDLTERKFSSFNDAIMELTESNRRIEKQLKISQIMQWLTMVVLIVSAAFMFYVNRIEMLGDNEKNGDCTKNSEL